ncbi:phosphatidate cytidylyltransferase [Pseudoduganella chitinolytica]|uniref:Phosphatidate cytidylyltransferase n=1 Tax=Pseudoduganella chitinolytica TaxID=34070 RepID=A0ABY8BE46_9BURK|nr:phosphatidate cytidylyltransferase [Pseudoduganella chitinolytica]WEF34175.1 phosphatidate cytidylyltransferase [Pseudoduganella chitinolytica]
MLKTRIITAVVLLVVVLAVLFSGSAPAVQALVALTFGAAVWEAFRLFTLRGAVVVALCWTAAFAYTFFFHDGLAQARFWFGLASAIWLLRFFPSLKLGLPGPQGFGNTLLAMVYAVTVVACFVAILVLFGRSPVYLLSAMAIVWMADIGAYFAGKKFGKRKLAPSISPGKSWEGAVGGWIAVLVLASATVLAAPAVPLLQDTVPVHLQARMGWGLALLALTVLVIASVVGDLFESQLKRRAGFKDSSNLLPGHGGVLDRIDALVPVLPLVALMGGWQ